MSRVRALAASRRFGSIALLLLAALPAAGAQQQPAAPGIRGVVVDSASGVPLVGVEVALGRRRGLTDENGIFQLPGTRTEADTLRLRRLGFRPRVVALTAEDPATGLQLALAVIAQQLAPVVVEARWNGYTGRLAGYYERLERRTIGQFITRAELDAEQTGLLTNVLQRMPGIQVRRGKGAPVLSMRGRDCRPLVWIDGAPLTAGAVDLDSFSPSSLHGIELYLGAMSAPLRFQSLRGQSECGTILLWSRGPDTDPLDRPRSTPGQLERLIADEHVFTADQVDTVARVQGGGIVVPYPPLLKAMNVTGSVTVEFIVDADGRMEPESFGIVAATDPRFAEHILDALQAATYTPAMRNNARVRQLVRQRFSFGDRS